MNNIVLFRIPQQKWFICTYEKQHGLRECGFYGTLPAMNEHFAEHTYVCFYQYAYFQNSISENATSSVVVYATTSLSDRWSSQSTKDIESVSRKRRIDVMNVENDYGLKKTDGFLRSIYIRAEEEERRIGLNKNSQFYDWTKGPKNRYGMTWEQFRVFFYESPKRMSTWMASCQLLLIPTMEECEKYVEYMIKLYYCTTGLKFSSPSPEIYELLHDLFISGCSIHS
ncbi:hypothetical protein CRE_08397 [Caenorhabditis remanei]|uniref:Uncharacterized protein n=1 Tax=Caenorhabditis remanei TaxID=31234 RepID=E3MPI3_CAERE|nr:hypothetical protein CRE_08397 [Caenorhabditis remanei]